MVPTGMPRSAPRANEEERDPRSWPFPDEPCGWAMVSGVSSTRRPDRPARRPAGTRGGR